ncbi:MAG: hypothetical protein IPN26_12070 [Bacteroidetes bacterium]|nr:hypothetical protein [Bacteroidota bacterium]
MAPGNTAGVELQLAQPSFLPLTQIEKDALDLNKIEEQIEINTEWVNTENRPYFVVNLVPIRKNPATGVYENLFLLVSIFNIAK